MAALPGNVSLLTPLTTPDPNTDKSESQIPRIIGASAVLLSVSTIAVILRFVARRLSRAPLWLDDWFILASLVHAPSVSNVHYTVALTNSQFFSWGANICLIVGMDGILAVAILNYKLISRSLATTYGFGRHITITDDLFGRMEVASHWFKLL